MKNRPSNALFWKMTRPSSNRCPLAVLPLSQITHCSSCCFETHSLAPTPVVPFALPPPLPVTYRLFCCCAGWRLSSGSSSIGRSSSPAADRPSTPSVPAPGEGATRSLSKERKTRYIVYQNGSRLTTFCKVNRLYLYSSVFPSWIRCARDSCRAHGSDFIFVMRCCISYPLRRKVGLGRLRRNCGPRSTSRKARSGCYDGQHCCYGGIHC